MPASAPRHALGDHHVGPRYVVDLRDQPPDQFDAKSTTDDPGYLERALVEVRVAGDDRDPGPGGFMHQPR